MSESNGKKTMADYTLSNIKAKLREMYESHGRDIEAGRIMPITAKVFEEMRWLVQQLEKGKKVKKEEEEVSADVPPELVEA